MDRQKNIIEMFDQIAPTYDSANRILSLGIDVGWRREACKKAFEYASNKNNILIVDVACGTGDMILHWYKNASKFGKSIQKIIGVDPSEGMLEIAKEKLQKYLQTQEVALLLGEAKDLKDIQSESADILSIAFGLRNVVDIQKALQEFGRVLKKDGILIVLEFTKKEKESFLDKITGVYTKKILPLIGAMVSRNYKAYKYLPDSIDEFLSVEKLKEELYKVGIETKFLKGYSAGIATLLIGMKQ